MESRRQPRQSRQQRQPAASEPCADRDDIAPIPPAGPPAEMDGEQRRQRDHPGHPEHPDHPDHADRHERETRTLHALQALTDTALSHLSLEALLPELLERVRTVMQMDSVAILLLDDATHELEISVASGPEEAVVGQMRVPVGEGFAGRIAATRTPLAVEDLSTYPVVNSLLQQKVRSALGVPLLTGNRVVGVMHIGTTTPHSFTADETALLEQAADRIAHAIERAQLFRVEQNARLAAQRQASLINLSFEPIFAWSLEAGIVEWNAGAEQLYGYTRAEAVGQVSHDLLRTAHAEPSPIWLAALERDGRWSGELRHTTKDGREVIVESRQQIIELDGERLVLETNRDVTERRQLEQRTRAALEAFHAITRAMVAAPGAEGENWGDVADSADAVAPSRDSGASDDVEMRGQHSVAHRLAVLTRGVLGCSRASISAVEGDPPHSWPISVVGLSPKQARQWRQEQQAQPPQELGAGLTPDDRDRLLAGETLILDLTRPPYELPNRYGVTAVLVAPMRAQQRIVGLLVLDFQDAGGQPHPFTTQEIHLVEAIARLGAVVLDHERLMRERAAAQAEALALAEAQQRMDEFLSIASHELRTPLTTMKVNLQLAERRARQLVAAAAPDSADDQRSSHLRRLGGIVEQLLSLLERSTVSVERQERLVRDLLDVSRISLGRLEYRLAPYDLGQLLREAVEEQRAHAPERHITLVEPTEPIIVTADADRIGQVVTNYLTNALKYSDADRPVAVEAHLEGSAVRVEVRDQGPGLMREQQRQLFERFYRVPGIEVVSGSGVGLGLGLFISKTIVEQHGGTVGVASERGAGSVFWFTLPLAPPASS